MSNMTITVIMVYVACHKVVFLYDILELFLAWFIKKKAIQGFVALRVL